MRWSQDALVSLVNLMYTESLKLMHSSQRMWRDQELCVFLAKNRCFPGVRLCAHWKHLDGTNLLDHSTCGPFEQ